MGYVGYSEYAELRRHKMTVAELIEELKNLPQDSVVALKLRDASGKLEGVEFDFFPYINHKSNHNADDADFELPEGLVLM